MSGETGSSGSDLCSVDFEIFGYVQGTNIFFANNSCKAGKAS